MDTSTDGDEEALGVDDLRRWQEAGALIGRIAPAVLRQMVAAAEATAIALARARSENMG